MLVSALRSHLAEDLKALPGSSNLVLHVLVSPNRKCTGLFPHTSIPQKQRPTVFQQDYLILVSQSPSDDTSAMCLVSAVEAVLYSMPSTHASLVYISKVDSTGQVVPGAGSPTAALVKSLLRWFTQPSTRPSPLVRIQLFARAQNQYLFPNSSVHPGKRVLTDVKLCRWWKDVLTGLVEKHQEEAKPEGVAATAANPALWQCFYLFPGLSLMEAEYMLKNAKSNGQPDVTTVAWAYSHPYASSRSRSFGITSTTSTTENGSPPESPLDIFDHIPTFPDDPKARFLHELAATDKAEANAPARKKLKARHSDPMDQEDEGEGSPKPTPSSSSNNKKTPSISQDEFWERMTFRQECSSGAVTGFFTVGLLTPVPLTNGDDSARSPSHEEDDSPEALAQTTSEAEVGCIPAPMVARIMASLGNLDFGSSEKARHATQLLTESIKGLCNGLTESGTTDPAASPARTAEGEDYYPKYIAASFAVNNPPLPTKLALQEGTNGAASAAAAPAVNVLQVRKKKRPAA